MLNGYKTKQKANAIL